MTITALPRMGSGRTSAAKRLQFHAAVLEVVDWMQQYVARLGSLLLLAPGFMPSNQKASLPKAISLGLENGWPIVAKKV